MMKEQKMNRGIGDIIFKLREEAEVGQGQLC